MRKEPSSQHPDGGSSESREGSVLASLLERLGGTGYAHFEIIDEIARGGMGVVMMGRDDDLGREVAIKMLHEELSDNPLVVERFIEEAQISGQLQHPGIVPVYELGLSSDRRPFFAMKLVKGGTLADALEDRVNLGADRRRMLSIFESLAQTVAYAHSRGVIHRDLKPSNVMVGSFGEVLLVDWGLAKVMATGATDERAPKKEVVIATVRSDSDSASGHSTTGTVMGTLSYMSPEQARGEVDELDERTDVFALGAILCEILTGKPPYPKDRATALRMARQGLVHDALVALTECGADAKLIELAGRCLAPDREHRPKDASVVATLIAEWLASSEARAHAAQVEAAEARARVAGERRARRLTIGLAGSIVFAVVLTVAFHLKSLGEEAGRLREAEESVAQHLTEASFARGRGQWNDARIAIAQARARIAGADNHAELAARIDAEEVAIEVDVLEAREQIEILARRNEFIAAVETIRDRVARTNRGKLQAYAALFDDFGIDLDVAPEEVASTARAKDITEELARALVDRARLQRVVAGTDDAEAARLVNLAIAIDSDPRRTALRRAILEQDLDELSRFAQAERSGELEPMTVIVLSDELWVLGERTEAVALLQRAELRHPDDFHIHVKLAARHMNLLETDAALTHLKAALARVPDNAWVLASLGIMYLRNDDVERAVIVCGQAVEADPEDSYARHYLGVALAQQGDDDAAIECYRKAVELEPEYIFALRRLGYALSEAGRHAESLDAFVRAADLAPDDPGTLNSAAWRLAVVEDETLRDPARALALAERMIDLEPADPDFMSTYGACLYRSERFEESVDACERAIDLSVGIDRELTEIFFLAMANARLGRSDKAREWLARSESLVDDEEGSENARLYAEARAVLAE